MNFNVYFHPQAEAELREAAVYFDNESFGLGRHFLDDLQYAINLISFTPEISPVIKKNVRRKPLRKFPYSLFYIVFGSDIRILAVAHQRRRPFYWKYRQ